MVVERLLLPPVLLLLPLVLVLVLLLLLRLLLLVVPPDRNLLPQFAAAAAAAPVTHCVLARRCPAEAKAKAASQTWQRSSLSNTGCCGHAQTPTATVVAAATISEVSHAGSGSRIGAQFQH